MCLGRPVTSAAMRSLASASCSNDAHPFDVSLAVRALGVQRRRDPPIFHGLELAEGEILELPLQLPDAEAIGERCVEVACLERDAPAFVLGQLARMTGLHELRGETSDHEPRIADDGEQHLAQRLGLRRRQRLIARPMLVQRELAETGQRLRELRRRGAGRLAHRRVLDATRGRTAERGVQQCAEGE